MYPSVLNRQIGVRACLAALAAMMLALYGPAPARATAVLNVGCSAPDLISAINAANAAGGGTINLAAGCSYTFTAANNDTEGSNALPVITGLTAPLTINGNGATLARSQTSGTPAFRLMQVGVVQLTQTDPGMQPVQDPENLNVTISDLTFTGGSSAATRSAGALLDNSTELSLNDVTMSGNTAPGVGGAIAVIGGPLALATLTIADSTISGNATTGSQINGSEGGGIFTSDDAGVNMTASTLNANTTNGDGGGAAISDGATLTDDTITGNSAADGGALAAFDSPVKLFNDTIAGNTAPSAPAVFTENDLLLRGTIIVGKCVYPPGVMSAESEGFNVNPGDTCPMASSPSNPCPAAGCDDIVDVASADLAPLASNGGPTETEAINPDSPALGLEPAVFCPPADERGVRRPQAVASNCDAGAYQTQEVATTLAYDGPTSGADGQPLTLSATLTHPLPAIGVATPAGGPVAGQTVSLQLGSESCAATTDASGTAACSVTPSDSPAANPYSITARYLGGPTGTGTDAYLASSDTAQSFTVTQTPTSPVTMTSPPTTASSPAATTNPTVTETRTSLIAAPQLVLSRSPKGVGLGQVSARLTGGALPLAGRSISFSAGGKRLCDARTDAAGTAHCRLSTMAEQLLLRSNSYTARFAGRDDLKSSSAVAPVVELGSAIAHDNTESQSGVQASGTLMRGHKLYARLLTRRAHGDERVALHPLRRLAPGRYRLSVTLSSGERVRRTIRIA